MGLPSTTVLTSPRTGGHGLYVITEGNAALCVCTTSSLSTPASGRLGCFPVLATVNSAAINTGEHVSFLIVIFSVSLLSSLLTCLQAISLSLSPPPEHLYVGLALPQQTL